MNNLKLLYLLILAVGIANCRDAEVLPKDYPTVATTEATNIDVNGVTLNATVTSLGTQVITDYGFIVTFRGNQIVYSLKSALNSNSFKTRITSDLDSGEVYGYKAYMRTKQNLVLGNDLEFKSKGSGNIILSEISPKEGFANTKVKITGQNFSKNTIKIFLNNQETPITNSTSSTIEFVIPINLKPMEYEVKVISGKRSLILPQKFKVSQTTILLVSPLSGKPGQEITVTGENLLRGESTVAISFGGIVSSSTNIIFSSESLIKVEVPMERNFFLADMPVDISVQNGDMKTTYTKKFIVKKTWDTKNNIPFEAPQNGFTYQNRVYIYHSNGSYMYRYDPNLDVWEKIENSQPNADNYYGALYIPFNNKFYKVGGYDHVDNPIKSYWTYNIDNNTWGSKKNLPFSFRCAGYFILNNIIYVLTSNKQLWKCNFENNTFVQLNDFPDQPTNDFILTFMANGQAYAVQYGKIWQYNSVSDSWTHKSFNHFTYDHYGEKPICINYNNTGYFFEYGVFIYKYDYINEKLSMQTLYPLQYNTISNKSMFDYNNKLYVIAKNTMFSFEGN